MARITSTRIAPSRSLPGPYVKQGSVIHERYSTVNMVRTIEDVLGLGHLNLNDAYQRPMTAVFDLKQSAWTYDAVTPAPIAREISGSPFAADQSASAFHDAQSAAYWARQTRGFDWSQEDRVPAVLFNQILWKGLTGGLPYPTARDQQDYEPRSRCCFERLAASAFCFKDSDFRAFSDWFMSTAIESMWFNHYEAVQSTSKWPTLKETSVSLMRIRLQSNYFLPLFVLILALPWRPRLPWRNRLLPSRLCSPSGWQLQDAAKVPQAGGEVASAGFNTERMV